MIRLDVYLAQTGLAGSREQAKAMILQGLVHVNGKIVEKPSFLIDETQTPLIKAEKAIPYVGRGGLKLEGALKAFDVDPAGFTALDVGASTGGFTDCLLQRGAKRIFALDAGHDQLDKTLKKDPRVVSMEGQNAREMTPALFGGVKMDLIVMDVSFISATYLLPLFHSLLGEDGIALVLVKPQFEVGKAMIGKKGIVKDPAAHFSALKKVVDSGLLSGLSVCGACVSPIFGGDGNKEFFAYFKKEKAPCSHITDAELHKLVFEKERRDLSC
ncbi:MAG: TlyA family RNA methyltransferase [Clostridia bacterium]|nr:TlyA family RNA methyltransferase [Clostridia bacterium]